MCWSLCMCVCVCTCLWRPEDNLKSDFWGVIHHVLATDVLTSLELALSCTSQSVRNPRALPTSALPVLGLQVCTTVLRFFFNMGSGELTQVLMLSRQVLYQLNYPLSPSLMVFFKHKMQEVPIVACLFLWWFMQNWSCGDAIEWKELGYGNEMDYFLFLEFNRILHIILHVIKKMRHSLMQPSEASLSPCSWGWPWTSDPPVSPVFCKHWLYGQFTWCWG